MWWLALALADDNRTFELGARRAWRPGSTKMDMIADQTILLGTSRARTECFSGNEKYIKQKVLCDRECLKDVGEVARASGGGPEAPQSRCNGPWYCSRTEICEMFRKASKDDASAVERSCAVVYGCANHSQCFPSEDEATRMSIVFDAEEFEIRDNGFTMRYGGITATTTCCANNRQRQSRYRLFVDEPCNSAARVGGGFFLLFVTIFVLLLAY